MNNLHFENEILHETFNDYYSRVRVQEENLKAMDQKIQEIAKSEAFRERVGILRCFRGVDYLTAMFLLSEVNDFRRFKTDRFFYELFRTCSWRIFQRFEKKTNRDYKNGKSET
ncbi:transposase for insertion sequence element IS1533 family protein [Leptospira interrogans serovar Grippotyphosa str. LT2186]|uniref:Transposase for insertion sequence element IS1533 family protein n=1 Tax=Leptospira interrogans serovar Grippotyphosa str. LT2186 TaxID=1001599 RepID=M3HKT2_LEPIR|nr:transposase for insertion sequence element IS1533 family protein [Leptospira interrogans serovar Grippotyphosa str. LT2186]